jgi:hypothetical protein
VAERNRKPASGGSKVACGRRVPEAPETAVHNGVRSRDVVPPWSFLNRNHRYLAFSITYTFTTLTDVTSARFHLQSNASLITCLISCINDDALRMLAASYAGCRYLGMGY